MNCSANRVKCILIGISIFFLIGVAAVFAQEPSVSDFTPASPDAFAAILQFYQRDMLIHSVLDYRRLMDYLATRSEIDSTRICY